MAKQTTTRELVDEREKTHGSFEDNAEAFASLLDSLPLERYPRLARYSVAAIYIKLARMTSGEGGSRQHWEDVAGYAEKQLELIDSGKVT